MNVLPRTKFGNPILRKQAKPVSIAFIKSKKFPAFIRSMFHTMRRAHGIGLAAPQIGEPLQLAVIRLQSTKTRPNLKEEGRFVIINPKILSYSKEQNLAWEGCLSFPGVRGVVPRHKKITVRYTKESGEVVTEKHSGFLARVFQHEIDHLNGLVYVDRMRDTKTLSTEEEYIKRVIGKKS